MGSEVSAIATRIRDLRVSLTDLNDEERLLWKRFFEICDDLAGEKESYKAIITEIEYVIAREMHQVSPKLLVDDLKKELTHEQWKAITRQERVFDIAKLETAIGKGVIDLKVVTDHTELKSPIAHKIFKAASKKEMEKGNE